MSETQPLKFNPKSIRDRIQSLEAVHMLVSNFLTIDSPRPACRTAILVKGEDGEVRDYDLTSRQMLAYAEQGLNDAIRRAKEQEVRLESERVKRAETTKRVAELTEELRKVTSLRGGR